MRNSRQQTDLRMKRAWKNGSAFCQTNTNAFGRKDVCKDLVLLNPPDVGLSNSASTCISFNEETGFIRVEPIVNIQGTPSFLVLSELRLLREASVYAGVI